MIAACMVSCIMRAVHRDTLLFDRRLNGCSLSLHLPVLGILVYLCRLSQDACLVTHRSGTFTADGHTASNAPDLF